MQKVSKNQGDTPPYGTPLKARVYTSVRNLLMNKDFLPPKKTLVTPDRPAEHAGRSTHSIPITSKIRMVTFSVG